MTVNRAKKAGKSGNDATIKSRGRTYKRKQRPAGDEDDDESEDVDEHTDHDKENEHGGENPHSGCSDAPSSPIPFPGNPNLSENCTDNGSGSKSSSAESSHNNKTTKSTNVKKKRSAKDNKG